MRCDQACPYNTLNGCKVNEYNGICPLSNMAAQKKTMTNADRIRAMSDEELAKVIICPKQVCDKLHILVGRTDCEACSVEWLKQPVEE